MLNGLKSCVGWNVRTNTNRRRNRRNEHSACSSQKKLPKASKSDDNNSTAANKKSKIAKVNSNKCECSNCTILFQLTECGVCYGPVQGHGVQSCRICFNLTCRKCASKLQTCAFCRTNIQTQRNEALDRILNHLFLPCSNSRNGCQVLLDGTTRLRHEKICIFSRIMCPKSIDDCNWQGLGFDIEAHLKTAHSLAFIQDRHFCIQITQFNKITRTNNGRRYTICFSCYDQLFFLRLALFKKKLKIYYAQLGYRKQMPEEFISPNYGVTVQISRASRGLNVVIPFKMPFNFTRKVEFRCERLYLPNENPDNVEVVFLDIQLHKIKSFK